MNSIRGLLVLACFLPVLTAGCDFAPSPTPQDYKRGIGPNKMRGDLSCDVGTLHVDERVEKQVMSLGGGIKVGLAGAMRMVLFDSASPASIEEHEALVLSWAHPSAYEFRRVGPHLLICAPAYWQEILLIRQYCYDRTAEPPWSNQFEEITFPQARETWLADEIYDSLGADRVFPSLERIRDDYELKEHAEAAAEGWRVRPFRDVLPSGWFAAFQCDRDLATAAKNKD